MDRRLLIVSALAAGFLAGTAPLAGDAGTAQAPSPAPAVKTGKERLGDKASDEQRVDDCNVPPERRGPRLRPTDCGRRAEPAEPSE